jgi:hypothetical protein
VYVRSDCCLPWTKTSTFCCCGASKSFVDSRKEHEVIKKMEEWVEYDKKCPECGGDMLRKKNKKGAMATVKHAKPSPNCSLKMWSVKDGGSKGTERTEEESGEGKAAKKPAGGSPSASAQAGATSGGDKTGTNGGGKSGTDDSGKNASQTNKPAPGESYSEQLKRIYGG